ncbi:hypothetical protein [Streptomyces sp. NPDC058545]|uniref:hypothetical protein n=1 Tax=Streptomyces sp. NPDC058545 TaxID=3346544 RepID=UPI00364CE337
MDTEVGPAPRNPARSDACGRRCHFLRPVRKMPKLSEGQLVELEKELARPAMRGWEDRRWTLARIGVLIAARLRIDCPPVALWATAAQAWPALAVSRPLSGLYAGRCLSVKRRCQCLPIK